MVDPASRSGEWAAPLRVVTLGWAPGAGAPMRRVERLTVFQDGVAEDRYRTGRGHWSHDRISPLTLIHLDDVRAASHVVGRTLDPLALRRNVVVDGGSLDAYVGLRFRLGDAVLEGERPCDPCRYLEGLTGVPGLKASLAGRGGLRVRVAHPGGIATGDTSEVLLHL